MMTKYFQSIEIHFKDIYNIVLKNSYFLKHGKPWLVIIQNGKEASVKTQSTLGLCHSSQRLVANRRRSAHIYTHIHLSCEASWALLVAVYMEPAWDSLINSETKELEWKQVLLSPDGLRQEKERKLVHWKLSADQRKWGWIGKLEVILFKS